MDIFDCIKKGDTAHLRSMLNDGVSAEVRDRNGMTPLMLAVDYQNLEMVRLLVKYKESLNAQDKYGQTALMLAAGRNFAKAVNLLIAARADLKLVSKSGLTALGFALDNDNRESADILRKAGGTH